LLDEESLPDDKPVGMPAGDTQLARLADPPPAALPLLPELTSRDQIRAAQAELKRLGCFVGPTNGRLSQDLSVGLETAERSLGDDSRSLRPLTSEVLEFLKARKAPVCTGRIGCGPGQVKQATTCIAAVQPTQPTRRARAVEEDDEPAPRRQQRQPPRQRAETPQRQPAATPRATPAPATPAPSAPRPSINLTM
jgi:diadenosine tetraphosphatase ApaH/serine/threonine PP2A family protein phosphatase